MAGCRAVPAHQRLTTGVHPSSHSAHAAGPSLPRDGPTAIPARMSRGCGDGCSSSPRLMHRAHASAWHMTDTCILACVRMGGGRFCAALIEGKIWEQVWQNNLSILHLILHLCVRCHYEESDKIKVLGFIILNRCADCRLVMPTVAFTYITASF